MCVLLRAGGGDRTLHASCPGWLHAGTYPRDSDCLSLLARPYWLYHPELCRGLPAVWARTRYLVVPVLFGQSVYSFPVSFAPEGS